MNVVKGVCPMVTRAYHIGEGKPAALTLGIGIEPRDVSVDQTC